MKEKIDKASKHSNKCTLTEIYKKKSGYLNPTIVTFQNGKLRDQTSDVSVVLTPTDNRTSVEVKTSDGHVFKESNICQTLGKSQFIAIRSRKKNKIRLVEVDSAVLINSALVATSAVNYSASEFSKEIKNLYRTFGGKKAVTQVVRAEKLNFSSMPVPDELKQTLAEMKVETDDSIYKGETESIIDLLPPCHRSATVVSDVYQIKDILSERELEALIEEIKVMEENKFNPKESLGQSKEGLRGPITPSVLHDFRYSQFFMNCYSEAKKYEGNLMIRLAGILFAETLIKFLNIQPKKLASKRVVLCPFSSIISEKLINEFCIKKESSVTRPLNLKDKCLCYIIAICLICCDYKINLQLLQTEITSVNLSRLIRLARVVGAVPVSKEEHLYTLKLPLPPLPKSQKRRLTKK